MYLSIDLKIQILIQIYKNIYIYLVTEHRSPIKKTHSICFHLTFYENNMHRKALVYFRFTLLIKLFIIKKVET